jgi:hypothetical protein
MDDALLSVPSVGQFQTRKTQLSLRATAATNSAMATQDTAFVAGACQALSRELASAGDGLGDETRAVCAARVAHLLARLDAVAAVDAQRAETVEASCAALARESAHAAAAERELQLMQARILCAHPAELGVGPCATACSSTWHSLAASNTLPAGAGSPPSQKAEAAFASALISHKADLMSRTAVASEAVQARQLAETAMRGGLWMDVSSASPDVLCQNTVQRRY